MSEPDLTVAPPCACQRVSAQAQQRQIEQECARLAHCVSTRVYAVPPWCAH